MKSMKIYVNSYKKRILIITELKKNNLKSKFCNEVLFYFQNYLSLLKHPNMLNSLEIAGRL